MSEQERGAGTTGGFFAIGLSQIDKMAELGARAGHVMAYLVLCRGVNVRGGRRLSTHGVTSIVHRTGMTGSRTTQLLGWLKERAFIAPADTPNEDIPKNLGTGNSRGAQPRWIIPGIADGDVLYLANELVDGLGRGRANPPLMRLHADSKNSPGRPLAEVKLDSLMVLLHLHRHHDLDLFGGVDPRWGIYREWVSVPNAQGRSMTLLDGTDAALYEIKGNDGYIVALGFVDESIFYADGKDRLERFKDAFGNLSKLGFVYEVVQVWSEDPNDKRQGRGAEPLYTLYIRDRHARAFEPTLYREIHDVAFRLGIMDQSEEFKAFGMAKIELDADNSDVINICGTGRFRYICSRKSRGFPIGIYRLRFRPKSRDTGLGMAAERQRVDEWKTRLHAIRPAG